MMKVLSAVTALIFSLTPNKIPALVLIWERLPGSEKRLMDFTTIWSSISAKEEKDIKSKKKIFLDDHVIEVNQVLLAEVRKCYAGS